MTVLITGGLGHIGSYVAGKLAEQGESVIIMDEHAARFDEIAPDYLRKVRNRLVLEQGSVVDIECVKSIFDRHKGRISTVIHLAGLGGVDAFVSDPHASVFVNIAGTLNVMEAARLTRVKRVVYISSGAVYGQRSGILREDDSYQADDLYGVSKISGELLTMQYGETFDIECCCARVYFVYGPGRMPSKMYPLYRTLFGPLEGVDAELPDIRHDQRLDFTYIDDTAQGIMRICGQRDLHSRIYNISSGRAITIGEAAQAVRDWAGLGAAPPAKGRLALKRGAPLDITRAMNEIAYKPNYVDFSAGIGEYGEWIKRQSGN
jgi:nucleoside-diphosphate-sugar epimerase